MSRHLAWFFLTVVTLAMSAPLQALNYEVGGCKTGSGYGPGRPVSVNKTGERQIITHHLLRSMRGKRLCHNVWFGFSFQR
jgi:hypothetical protein